MRVHGTPNSHLNPENKEHPMPKSPYVDFKAVKAAVSILQILDHYQLTDTFKRNGDSLTGPCPLHGGQSPTQFRVSLSKNCWNCFSECKSGGNILDFVSRREGVNIRDAAIRISEWFNLPLEKPGRNGESVRNGEPKSTDAPKQPAANAPKPARPQPTAEKREPESGENKPLGFNLQNLDTAHPYFAERGLTSETMAEFGLGFCNKGSMTGRIVIPIHNAEGQLLAYAGRWPGTPPAEDTPKYRLPPGFKKSLVLFNLHRAVKADPGQPLIVVEGFFDCMNLWQHGIRRVVALMGSTLSPAQEELIVRYTKSDDRIVLMLDEDDAGRAGCEQALQRLAPKAFVKAFRFPKEGQQPDQLSAGEIHELLTPLH
jgi:DNA primase